MTFRGNTLVDIQPRMKGNVYQLFLRDEMRSSSCFHEEFDSFRPQSTSELVKCVGCCGLSLQI